MKLKKDENAQSPLAAAWREIQPKLQRRARHLCKGDSHRADELLSDTALKVHLYLQHSASRVQNLAGFIFLVLNHAFLDATRRRGRENRVFDRDCDWDADHIIEYASGNATPEQQLDLKQQLDGMAQARAALNPQQQQLFTLKFEQDQSYPEIASALGINQALARKRVELLRKKLRNEMA
ncbi:RNA polymerase subunit sigma-24 [Chromobacterium phragmitis]|uniref:RNA polymerase sigma factor n=1 Tax=Chromobacterium phragmitis TaxID=2202141 RepID=UPI000DEC2D33|nr:RNA polymerase sigma factor [Chromobacterium phragmitis]AXE29432.1 RNA polymerase subunit sigma-24 [Chromobacterium phragmitis]